MNSLELKIKMENYWNYHSIKMYGNLNRFVINKFGNIDPIKGTTVKFKSKRKKK